jgi:mRNA interferase MazF
MARSPKRGSRSGQTSSTGSIVDDRKMKRGEIWWADLGRYRPREQTGRRPVIIWQSDALTAVLESVLVVPLTTNLDRANLAGTSIVEPSDLGPSERSVALTFQMRAVPKSCLDAFIRVLTSDELAELELATDETLGRVEPIG